MKYGRIDENQPEIVAALRKIGASVQSLADIGGGCPDLLVGYRGRSYVLEVKMPGRRKTGRHLTPPQQRYFANWRGTIHIVESVAEAIEVVTKEDAK